MSIKHEVDEAVSPRSLRLKRARTDEEPTGTGVDANWTQFMELKKHEMIWYEDRNIVLVAQQTVAFKVYRGILSRRSEVFRGMFAKEHKTGDMVMDGCPVFEVSDRPTDLAHFLSALFDRTYFDSSQCSFDMLASMLRLGTKYRIEDLRGGALTRLNHCFPPRLDAWTLNKKDRDQLIKDPSVIVGIANLASELDLKHILYLSLYECCQIPARTLFEGYKHLDGSVEKLDWDLMGSCVEGLHSLFEESFDITTGCIEAVRPSSEQCARPNCPGLARSMSGKVGPSTPRPDPLVDRFTSSRLSVFGAYCDNCVKFLGEKYNAGRLSLFARILDGTVFPISE
ncbi:hypothetical protein JAAARDRAFT_205850 [Jaapia argillacea MUCL 33604]|uniref:BTB domain-containing protein n=1 Tax=Jaapia argillacea MUCL 33604 TaxID=933084 RepID=A0A067Q1D5_9AGAM|nr:hypothetical protein JAAARDRAFT_205850 [Jaapia argillacea MUCL 33604]